MYTKLALILVSIHAAGAGRSAADGGVTVTMYDPGAIDSQLTRRWPAALRFLQRCAGPARTAVTDRPRVPMD